MLIHTELMSANGILPTFEIVLHKVGGMNETLFENWN